MVFASVPAQNALMPMVLIEEGAVVTLSLKPPPGPLCGPWRLRTESSLNDDELIAAESLAARPGTSGRMPRYHGDGSNKSGVAFVTLIRSPWRLPQRTWTASSSPRLIRCITV